MCKRLRSPQFNLELELRESRWQICLVHLNLTVEPDVIFLHAGRDDNDIPLASCMDSIKEQLVGVETSHEWQPAPQVEHQLRYLNSYLMESTDGRISPVRSQCKSDVMTISSSSQRYYRKKASQAVNTVLNAIALGNLSWLLQKLSKSTIADELSLLLLKRTS